jgi:hypothetical protein
MPRRKPAVPHQAPAPRHCQCGGAPDGGRRHHRLRRSQTQGRPPAWAPEMATPCPPTRKSRPNCAPGSRFTRKTNSGNACTICVPRRSKSCNCWPSSAPTSPAARSMEPPAAIPPWRSNCYADSSKDVEIALLSTASPTKPWTIAVPMAGCATALRLERLSRPCRGLSARRRTPAAENRITAPWHANGPRRRGD